MTIGWNIFPLWAGIVMLIAATASTWAIMKRERSTVAIATMSGSILAMGGFIVLLWATLERPPLRTMGETRLWYSFFILEQSENGTPTHYEAQVMVDGTVVPLRVNHPYARTISEKIYLVSFPTSPSGERYAIVEIVNEPWQWLSATGIIMLLAGAMLLFIQGPSQLTKTKTKTKTKTLHPQL